MALLLTGGRLGPQTRKVLIDVYTSYLGEQPFDMVGGVAEAAAAAAARMIPADQCSYAVKAALNIPVPVVGIDLLHRVECACFGL
jgi:hypothetical protein